MERVVRMGAVIKERLFYCVTGVTQIVIPEKFITERDGFIIKSKQGFQVSIAPSNVIGTSKVPVLNINLGVMKNLELNCSLICDLSEEDPLYKGIVERMTEVEQGDDDGR